MIAAIIIFAICGLICLPQGGEIVWYGLAALGVAAVLLIIKIVKRSNAEQYVREREEEHEEAMRKAEIARREWEERERIRIEKSEAWNAVHAKWQVIIDEHTRLLNEIGVAYTVANNSKLPDSPEMQHVIDLCKQDIALAEMFTKSQIEFQEVRVTNGWAEPDSPTKSISTFPTFKRLAIIYEKQKKYDEAIAICQRAIELGYVDDGTDGQMPGRIARLMKKNAKDTKKIEPVKESIIEDTES